MNFIKHTYTYADILKGLHKLNNIIDQNDQTLTNQTLTDQTLTDKPKQFSIYIDDSFNNRLNILINKIFKSEKNNKFYNKAIDEIKKIILICDDSYNNIIKSIIKINDIINKYKLRKLIESNNINPNHEYVGKNIAELIKQYILENKLSNTFNNLDQANLDQANLDQANLDQANKTSNIKIVDIGGGEGNILKEISKELNIDNSNLYCIEQELWSEQYVFSNNINYIFWNNINIDLPPESIDVFQLIVSMHHMNDDIINNIFTNIKKIIKKDGIIIIKEHDMTNNNTLKTINWEHHIYHIVTTLNENLTVANLENYMITYINNFKSKDLFDSIIFSHGFETVIELDRQFKPFVKHDNLNATNLYWKVYKKIS
jgi:ubiquinone/menaquinone biosynthesis C-methylase UbiE